MTTDFLPVPESAVGNPVTVHECYGLALQAILTAMPVTGKSYDDEFDEASAMAWSAAYENLATGTLQSFVYDSEAGRWFRVPWEYWEPLDKLTWPLSNLLATDELATALGLTPTLVIPTSLLSARIVVEEGAAKSFAADVASRVDTTPVRRKKPDVSVVKTVPERRLVEWFKQIRVPAFTGLKPPTWEECWDAAKEAHSPLSVTKNALLEARRVGAPEWSKRGPRPE